MTGFKPRRAARIMIAACAAGAGLATVGAGSAGAATLQVCASTCTYSTIQSAVDAAELGLPGSVATITVGPGDYAESIEVHGDVSVSIVGTGVGKTVIEPDPATIAANAFAPPHSTVTSYPILFDDGAPAVSISRLTIDGMGEGAAVAGDAGAGPFVGVGEYDSNLTVNGVDITGMADAPPDTTATGEGIYAVNDSGPTTNTLAVANSVISDYQLGGVVVTGNSNLSVDVVGNSVTGDGGPANADGIVVSALSGDAAAGPSGSITDNAVAGNVSATAQSPLADGSVNGAGIRLNYVSTFTVDSNSAINNDVGVWSTVAPDDAVTVSNNTLEDSTQADALAGYGTNLFTGNTVVSLPNASKTPIGILVAGYHEDPSVAAATVTANTISGTDSAVEVAVGNTAGAVAPSATIANNALFGNINGVDNASTAAVDAIDNWWGCNGGPGANGCAQILDPSGGAVSATPYLVLGLSAAPSTIAPGASATIIASIRQDSSGASFAAGSFPSGLALTLASSAGSIASAATLVDGQVALPLSGTPLGIATVTATLDGQPASTTLTTSNSVNTASSTTPTTVTVTVPVPATLAPIIDFLSSGSLSLLARNPGSELALTCVDGCSASVSGKIVLAERQGKHKTVRRTLEIASTPLTIAASGSSVYAVSLTAAERKALAKATSATLTLTASAKDDSSGKVVTGSKSFTITRT